MKLMNHWLLVFAVSVTLDKVAVAAAVDDDGGVGGTWL